MRKLIIWKKCSDLIKTLTKDFMRLVMFLIGPSKSIKVRKKKYSTKRPNWLKGEQTYLHLLPNLIKINYFVLMNNIAHFVFLYARMNFSFSYFQESLILLFSTALKMMTKVKYITKGLRATIGKRARYWFSGKKGLN